MKNCATCYYSAERNGVLFCMGRKNMPFVRGWESCNAWEKRNGMFEPKTNADSIRTMSDEELAEWLSKHIECDICPAWHLGYADEDECTGRLLDWLKQEAEYAETTYDQ